MWLGSHMIDVWLVATVHWTNSWNRWEDRMSCVVLYFTISVLFTLQQYFSICRCIDFEWNPQMSQIGLSQLCRGLALSAVLVQGYWNCFDLASPSWIETTRKLNCCRKRLKILLVPSAKCTSYSLCLWQDPLPLISPHFVSHSVYLSYSVSHLLFHHILHLLHPASPVFSLKLIPVLPQIPPMSHVWRAKPKCHKKKKTWYQLNRSGLSRERSACPLGLAGLWPWLDEDMWDAAGPKVGTFLKSVSLSFSLCNADLCLQADTASGFVKHITVTQESGAKNNNTC